MLDIVTVGETMVAFAPDEQAPIRYARSFGKRTAGAESNLAVGMAKLGHRAGWVSKLGRDEFGEYILKELRGEGVDVSAVVQTDEFPTGLMFKQLNAGSETSVFYYRKGSAASTLCMEDLPLDYLKSAKILHLTGITPALSESCREMAFNLVKFAKENNMLLSFDPNIRLKLWNKKDARRCLFDLFPFCDIIMLGLEEAEILLGTADTDEIIDMLRKLGVQKIAIKMGKLGAIVADEVASHKIKIVDMPAVDNIGAGDAFNAGFLSGILENNTIKTCGEMGALMGAFAVSSNGDVEGLPSRSQFNAFINSTDRTIFR